MRVAILFFAFGVWICQWQAGVPAWAAACAFGLVCTLLGLLLHRSYWKHLVFCTGACLLGLAYAGWRADLRLAERLPDSLEGLDIAVQVRVADLPQRFERGLRFVAETSAAPEGVPKWISLAWYEPASVPEAEKFNFHPGEVWRFTVRLKQPHGSLNPGGFDYEGWLFERGIGATGYIRPNQPPVRIAEFDGRFMSGIHRLREHVRARFERALPDAPWRGVLIALAVGDQGAIPANQWSLFRQTGITHLVSISGLHVTLVGAMLAWGLMAVWRRVPWLVLRLPAQKAAMLGAAIGAGAYVLLAGSGVPAQRTFYMLAVAGTALWFGRTAGASRVLALALLLVLLIDPWAVLAAGFWLSFAAVGALMLVASGKASTARPRLLADWLRAQWAVTLLSIPLLLGVFQQFSLISPVTNALAIPLVSAVITPLALAFAVLPLPSLAELAHGLLGWLMVFLQWCAQLPFALWQQAAPPAWLIATCCLAALWALLPKPVPGRWAGLLCFVPLLSWSPPRPAAGEVEMGVIDVGQGLSVHVRTTSHDLLFDTGPAYSSEADAGGRIVLPYLRAVGINRLDMLVVSHNDNDHAGGAASIQQELKPVSMRSSLPAGHPLITPQHRSCRKGERWNWDGVGFEFLHPYESFTGTDNDSSCVLRIQSADKQILLTGDISSRIEKHLIAGQADRLHSDILVAAHHGSSTSSSQEFINAVAPAFVVFTAGYRNRFHHPSMQVLDRYQHSHVKILRSDHDGAVMFALTPAGIRVQSSRTHMARYWHDKNN